MPASSLLVSTGERTLPLRRTHADVEAVDGLARIVLRQRFENPHDVPLEVTYSLPLPAEAAVSGFSFLVGSRRIVGEIDARGRARARYDEAMALGHTAALVEQERDTLFTQSIGNVPPGAAVDAELVIDMKLRYLDEGSWELRLPTTVAPRYLGEAGRVGDAARIVTDVADGPMPVRFTFDVRLRGIDVVESPSHAVLASRSLEGALVARFADPTGVPLDRDVVLRWRASEPSATAHVRVTRPRGSTLAYALVTVTPPHPSALASLAKMPRDLVLLLDTSGSMGGQPIEQAKRVSLALVESLDEADSLEMIAFSSSPKRWKGGATSMTRANREAAIRWLSSLEATGGTEMREAIFSALQPLRDDGQRQVVLVTDGLIGFESEIVRTIIDRLPRGSRVHTVGVGSGINRTLTAGAARAGRGIEVIADASEDPERIAARIVARTKDPLVTELTVQGAAIRELAPLRMPDLFAGAPVTLAMQIDPAGGAVTVEGRGARGSSAWRTELTLPPCEEGEGMAAIEQLYARERAADLEMSAAAGENVDTALEALGLAHHIATRMTSWIAVTEEKTVDENAPFRRESMPHALPYGTSAEGFGLRSTTFMHPASSLGGAAPGMAMQAAAPRSSTTGAPPIPRRPEARAKKSVEGSEPPKVDAKRSLVQRLLSPLSSKGQGEAAPALAAKIALVRERSLVIELTLTHDLDWLGYESAEVVLEGGARVGVRIVGRSAPQSLRAGTIVRLVVELDGPLADDVTAFVRAGQALLCRERFIALRFDDGLTVTFDH